MGVEAFFRGPREGKSLAEALSPGCLWDPVGYRAELNSREGGSMCSDQPKDTKRMRKRNLKNVTFYISIKALKYYYGD